MNRNDNEMTPRGIAKLLFAFWTAVIFLFTILTVTRESDGLSFRNLQFVCQNMDQAPAFLITSQPEFPQRKGSLIRR